MSVNLDVDTAGYNTIPPKYADTLGLSSEYSVSSFESYGQDIEHYELIAQIGSLKPVRMITRISTQSFGSGNNGVLGWANNGLSNWILDFIGSKMTLTEYNDPNANAVVPTGRYIELPLKTSTEFSKPVSGDYPCHDVKFYKRNSDKSITLKTLFDTGVKNTTLPKKNARMLGISDIEEGIQSTSPAIFRGNTPVEYYNHPIDVQVGNLGKVRNVMTRFSDFWNEAILGPDVIFKYKVRLTKNKIRYEELVPPTTASVKAESAYLIAHNYYTLGTRTGRNYRL